MADEITQFLNARLKTIEANMQSEIKIILMETGNEAVKKINSFISDWYDKYTYDESDPNHYKRTNQLRNCARYSITGNTVRVYMDMSRLRASAQNEGKGWQAHRSFDGEDFTYGLIDFLENGGEGKGSRRNPRRNDFGIHFLEQTQDWVNDYVAKEIDRKLRVLVRMDYKN